MYTGGVQGARLAFWAAPTRVILRGPLLCAVVVQDVTMNTSCIIMMILIVVMIVGAIMVMLLAIVVCL